MGECQRLKKVKVDNYELFCKEEYTVLRKNKSIKHGFYKSSWVSGNPRQEGYYHYNQKDSLWIYFHPFKPIIASRGSYDTDEKIGIWEYFDERERLINRYNHSTGVLSYTTHVDTIIEHTVRLEDTVITTKVDRAPHYLHGKSVQLRIIRENISYPQSAIDQNIFGTVIISFFVDKFGFAIDHKIHQSIGKACDEEALRVVKLISSDWVPGIYKGELAEVKVYLPITFQLN